MLIVLWLTFGAKTLSFLAEALLIFWVFPLLGELGSEREHVWFVQSRIAYVKSFLRLRVWVLQWVLHLLFFGWLDAAQIPLRFNQRRIWLVLFENARASVSGLYLLVALLPFDGGHVEDLELLGLELVVRFLLDLMIAMTCRILTTQGHLTWVTYDYFRGT